ncbi:MAG: DUF2513 domain-containing protein [Armatimonadetes bacterium]|nr:DUF2513 domain-containing protein [Armatimonadota bacterium]
MELAYHVKLLSQAGLIDVKHWQTGDGNEVWLPKTLTWQGHEFLDAARNDTTWNKAKGQSKAKAVLSLLNYSRLRWIAF